MRQRARWLGVVVLTSWTAAAAPPSVMSGLYHVGELGLVDFITQEGRVVGRFKAPLGEACAFALDTEVVSGVFEGSVFVGKVSVCQAGAGCEPQREVPVLGLWRDDALAASVKLKPGCTSAVLDGRALYVSPATVEEKQQVLGAGSAEQLAQRTARITSAEGLQQALSEGSRLLAEKDYRAAQDQFRRVVAYDEKHWAGHLGVGVTEVHLSPEGRALEHLERALALARDARVSSADLAMVHYNIGCAHAQLRNKKQALEALEQAVRLGGAATYVPELERDESLAPLRSEPAFRRLVANARTRGPRSR